MLRVFFLSVFFIWNGYIAAAQEPDYVILLQAYLQGEDEEEQNAALRDVNFRRAIAHAIDPMIVQGGNNTANVQLNSSYIDDFECASLDIRGEGRSDFEEMYGSQWLSFLDQELPDLSFRRGERLVNRGALREAQRILSASGYSVGSNGALLDLNLEPVSVDLRVGLRGDGIPAFDQYAASDAVSMSVLTALERLGITVNIQQEFGDNDILWMYGFFINASQDFGWRSSVPSLETETGSVRGGDNLLLECQWVYVTESSFLLMPLLKVMQSAD